MAIDRFTPALFAQRKCTRFSYFVKIYHIAAQSDSTYGELSMAPMYPTLTLAAVAVPRWRLKEFQPLASLRN